MSEPTLVDSLQHTAHAVAPTMPTSAAIALGILLAVFGVFTLIFGYTMIYRDLEDFMVHHFTAWKLGHALIVKCGGDRDKAVDVLFKVDAGDQPIEIPEE